MNAKFTAAIAFAIAAAVPGFAFAADDTMTRVEVRAEAVRALAAGELGTTEAVFPFALIGPRSGLTRAQVRADIIRARAAGELDFNEVNYPRIQPAVAPALTRAEVRAEAVRARAAGELDITEATPAFALR